MSTDRRALRDVLAVRELRSLLAVRMVGQYSDGVFQAALFSAVFFNPERATSASQAAVAFATLLLPYSVVGPFAGVLLDRWRRQRVLRNGNLARAVAIVVFATLLATLGPTSPPVVALALVVVSVNRFILSGLSAALPCVVDQRLLVTANSFTTTLGSGAAAAGGATGVGLTALLGAGDLGASRASLVAAGLYVVAAALAGRIALVTGAASGIGKAIATRLAAEGACVVIADLDLTKAQDAAAEIGTTDVAIGVQANVTDEAQVQASVDAALLAFGGLDLVVNNAGLSLSKSLLETTVADWDLQHNVMAKGSFLVSRAAAQVLIDQKLGGDIIYISSKNSVFAGPNNIAYSATKADQAHQVRLLAAELGEHGIKVNGINPDGVVRGSGIFAGGWGAKRAAVYGVDEDDLGKYYAQRTLLKREVLPENVANAVFVLCTNDLSHTTGLHIPVDAGVAAAFLR